MLCSRSRLLPGNRALRLLVPCANSSTRQSDPVVTSGPGSENASIQPNRNFVNRNPRNLERLAYSVKDVGWGMEWSGYARSNASNFPRREYYHRLVLTRTGSHTYAEVEHYYGDIVICACTKEKYIAKGLYSNKDVSACYNLGKIIASRCLRAGISCVSFRCPALLDTGSEAASALARGAEEEGLHLEEPDDIQIGRSKGVKSGPEPPKPDS